jgi:hypothetical protein
MNSNDRYIEEQISKIKNLEKENLYWKKNWKMQKHGKYI